MIRSQRSLRVAGILLALLCLLILPLAGAEHGADAGTATGVPTDRTEASTTTAEGDEAVAAPEVKSPQELAGEVDPYREPRELVHAYQYTGGDDAVSDVAVDVTRAGWFSFLIFLPFLILPQVLLVVIIIAFRDRGNGRKPATFIHNNKLELIWTAIPVMALVVVAIPMLELLDYTDKPHAKVVQGEALEVEVLGKQFSWVYTYPEYKLELASVTNRNNVPVQEPVVLKKDKMVHLWMTSQDVNHAWFVPAFGVKRDCFVDRTTHTWFTPKRADFFEGQCAELCGSDHGVMVITAVVLEAPDFANWVQYMYERDEANAVVAALYDGKQPEQAVRAYLEKKDSQLRRDALRFWLAYATRLEVGSLEKAQNYLKGAGKDAIQPKIDAAQTKGGELEQQLEGLLATEAVAITPIGTGDET